MKTNKILVLLLVFFVLASCEKIDNPVLDNTMTNLQIPSGFGWQTIQNNVIEVNTIGIDDGSTLALYNLDGDVISKKRVVDSKVVFDLKTQDVTDSLRLYSSATRMSKYFLSTETNVTFGATSYKNVRATVDYALDFNADNEDYIEINNGAQGAIVTNYPFTFSAWFKSSGPGVENYDMALVNIADPTKPKNYFGIFLDKAGHKWRPAIRSANYRTKHKNMNAADGTWHQVTGVFESPNRKTLYVDGIYAAKDTRNNPFSTDAVVLTLGRWGDVTPKSYFNGLMDNVTVWNKALTDAEVLNYYTNLPTGNEADLAAYWDFNEGSGSVVKNASNAGVYDGDNTGADYVLMSTPVPDADGDGVNDDDDDFPLDPTKAYLEIFPTGDNYFFQMFEDLWPAKGDYDFNDVILKTKIHTYKDAQNNLVGGRVISNVYWIGGGIPRGAGIEFLKPNLSGTTLEYLPENVITFTEVDNVVTDPLVNNAVQIFDDNIIESVGQTVDFEFLWDYNLGGNTLANHTCIYNDRDHEVHIYGQPPTSAQNMDLLGTLDDVSLTSWDWTAGTVFDTPANFYKTRTNLPWGLELITDSFRIPIECTQIIEAYPQFKDWAESGGTVNTDWYNNPDETRTFLPNE